MEYTVERVANDRKFTKEKKKEYWGVKLTNVGWVNVMGDCGSLKPGHTISMSEPKTIGAGTQLWAFKNETAEKTKQPEPEHGSMPDNDPPTWAKPELYYSPPLENPCCSNRHTLADWGNFVRDAWAVAHSLEEDDAQARAALVNTAVIAWARGDICYKEEEVPF